MHHFDHSFDWSWHIFVLLIDFHQLNFHDQTLVKSLSHSSLLIIPNRKGLLCLIKTCLLIDHFSGGNYRVISFQVAARPFPTRPYEAQKIPTVNKWIKVCRFDLKKNQLTSITCGCRALPSFLWQYSKPASSTNFHTYQCIVQGCNVRVTANRGFERFRSRLVFVIFETITYIGSGSERESDSFSHHLKNSVANSKLYAPLEKTTVPSPFKPS